MEGAVLAGKLASEVWSRAPYYLLRTPYYSLLTAYDLLLASEVVACKAAGVPTPNGGARVATGAPVPADAPEAPSAPGFVGNSPVAFGGGQTGGIVHP